VRTRVVISLLGAALSLGGATEAAQARHASYTFTRAWAGFVAESAGASFGDVRASWRVPRVVCNRPASSVAFWVGLGGATASSQALEQIGTAIDCSDRAVVSYSAWYQVYPATAVDLRIAVRPGETVTAEVRVAGRRVDLSFVNDSTGASVVKHLTATAPETDSAEWIAEAPSSCAAPLCTPLPVAHFGRVTFFSAAATVTGRIYALGDPRLTTELFAVGRAGDVALRPLQPRPLLAAGTVLG
jgi:hypothetical protein